MPDRSPPASVSDGPWLGSAGIRLSVFDVADSLGLAMGARLRMGRDRSGRFRAAVVCAFLAAGVAAVAMLPPTISAGVLSLCPMAVLAVVLPDLRGLLRLVMLPAAWVTLRQNAGLMEDASVAWRRTGLFATGQGSQVVTPWREIGGWDEGRAFVLHKPGAGYVIVPKRCLTGAQADCLRAVLEGAGVPRLHERDLRQDAAPDAGPMLAEPGPRRVTFQLTARDLVAARRHVIRQAALAPGTAWVALAAGLGAWSFGWLQTLPVAAAAGAACALVLRFVLPMALSSWAVRRGLRRTPGQPCQIEWDAEGFRGVYANGEIEKAWAEVRRWHVADTFVFLGLGPNAGQTIPLRALTPAQRADLEGCAAGAGVKGAGVKGSGPRAV